MTPIKLTDLNEVWFLDPKVTWIQGGYVFSKLSDSRPLTDPEVLSVLTDEALIGELVKRGVLRLSDEWRSSYDGSRRYVSDWDPAREPVGSVGP